MQLVDGLDVKLYADALDRKMEIKGLLFQHSLRLWLQYHNKGSETLHGNGLDLALSNFVITAQRARPELCFVSLVSNDLSYRLARK